MPELKLCVAVETCDGVPLAVDVRETDYPDVRTWDNQMAAKYMVQRISASLTEPVELVDHCHAFAWVDDRGER